MRPVSSEVKQRLLLFGAAVWLAVAVSAMAAHMFFIYTGDPASPQTSATVRQGRLLTLSTAFTSETAADTAGAVDYLLELPVEALDAPLLLNSRDYESYGWAHDDGLGVEDIFDNCSPIPAQSVFAMGVTAPLDHPDPFSATEETDVYFGTARADMQDLPGEATHRVEDLTIRIPPTMPVGTYTLAFSYLEVSTFNGSPQAAYGLNNTFTLNVFAVPEPAALALLLVAAACAFVRRR